MRDPVRRPAPAIRSLLLLSALTASKAALAQDDAGPRPEVIVVTASLIEQPLRQVGTAVSVLDGPEMELRGYHTLADALRTQPGIGVSNSGGPGKSTTLRIRGEEAFRTLLVIDGVKALDPAAVRVEPRFDSLLMTNDLERVEILRGPQGFIYGADAGGVVNVLTRTGKGPATGQVGLEYGEFDTRRLEASVSGGSDAGDYFFSVTDLETDGFNAWTADTVLADDDGADNTTLHTKLGWNATDNLRLQLVARDIDASSLYDSCFTASFEEVHDCLSTTEQTTYKVSADHRGDRVTHAFGYSNVDIARADFTQDASSFASEGRIGRFEYTGSFRPTDGVTLVYGLDLQREEVESVDETRERDQDGYYLEYQGAFADRFFLTLGARYDDNEDFGSHTSARLSGAYVQALDGGHSLKYRASFGTGFRPPSLFEIAYNRGPFAFPPAAGFELTEESSRGYDLGLELDTAAGLHFEVTYFDQQIEDEIFFDPVGFSGYLQSPGESDSTGVEIAAEVPLGERWQLGGNWTYNDSEDTSNEQRLRRPRNFGNLTLRYRSPSDKLRLIATYRVSRNSIDVGGVALDDYGVLDVSVAYDVSRTLELYGRLENATDERYQEVIGYNTAGRSAYAGVRLRF
ncbi:MAG TPA: TonB-dependent receptor [Gammaproteobacteria bacterium]